VCYLACRISCGHVRHDLSNEYHTRELHGGNIWGMRDDFLRMVGAAL